MFFRRKRLERRLESEIEYHLARVTQNYVDQGMDPQEARRRALLEFGGATQIQEDLRDVHRLRWLADLRQDVWHAARTLRRSPGFLACAVMTLGLGIGANTAIFSLIDALMLRPMPAVRDPSALVQLVRQKEGCEDCRVSYPLFEYFRDRLSSISGAFADMDIKHEITVDGVEELVNGDEVSGAYYSVLGLTPAAGRLLGPEDDAAPVPVAVISYDYWRRRFGLDPAAIGKSFTYAATTLTIVGVEPPEFEGVEPWRTRAFTVPLSMSEQLAGGDSWWRREWNWNANFLEVMGRLKPGVTMERANAEAAALFGVWRADKAATITQPFDRNRFLKERAAALPGLAGLNGLRIDFLKPLSVLMGIVALVLLLACANLSGLLLARASSRQREISVRRALGAGNGRLARQFLAESLLLAVCGAIAGSCVAQWFSRLLVTMMANGDELPLAVSPDWRIFAFTGAVSLLACVFAGLAPGLSAGRVSVNPSLKEVRTGGGHRGLGRLLVVSQLAISMTLLVGAGLFIRTLVKLYSVDTGVRTGGVFVFNVTAKHHFPAARSVAIQTAIVDRLRSLPGVTFASAANVLPLGGGLSTQKIKVEGYTFRPGEGDSVAFNAIAGKYFAVTGTPLLLGRDFTERDAVGGPAVAIVNESFMRTFFGGQAPLGRHVTSNRVDYEIVGVVKDAKFESLRKGVPNILYVPWLQQGDMGQSNRTQPMAYSYLARVGSGDPMRLAPIVDHAISEIDSAMRMWYPQTFEGYVNRTTLNERMMATLGGFFGLLALIVACLGIFGVLAFQVSRRINEIGVRVALGATRGNIVTLVMREVAMLLVPGCAVGAVAAAGLTRFANSMLFGVTATDPTAFALAAGALATATLAAGFLPALRASRVEPMAALRCE
jgi:predicted permease